MRRTRVHCALASEVLVLEGEEAHRLMRVLRVRPGDRFSAFDGSGVEALAEVVSVGTKVTARVLERSRPAVEAGLKVTLYLALVKGERFDWAVEKATELGVARLVPLQTERTDVRDPGETRRERWQRIAVSAAAQCGRVRVPRVEAPVSLSAVRGPGFLLAPGGPPLVGPWPEEMSLVIGPEGGFTDDEVRQAEQAGLRVAGLGPRVLRVETAAVAALSLVLLQQDLPTRLL